MATIADLASAIARFEGFLVPGSIAQRDNNPGNLRSGTGQIGTDSGGYAIFPDVATGNAALQRQIQLNINKGLTLDEFFGGKSGVYAGYAPAADKNNPGQYADTVAGWLGISPDVPLSQIVGQQASATPLFNLDFSLNAGDVNLPWTGDVSQDTSSVEGMSGLAWAAVAVVFIGVLVASR